MTTSSGAQQHLLSLVDVKRSFGGVHALRGVNFNVGYNEIVALIGDNGAGKTTLIKTITGVHQATSGDIFFKGKK